MNLEDTAEVNRCSRSGRYALLWKVSRSPTILSVPRNIGISPRPKGVDINIVFSYTLEMAIFINLGKLSIPTLFDDEEDLLELDLPTEEIECICEIGTLVCKGCQCGAMQKELASQA